MESRKRKAAESDARHISSFSSELSAELMTTVRDVITSTISPIVERLDVLERGSSSSSDEPANQVIEMPRSDNSLIMVQSPSKPTFDGTNSHPVTFIEDLETYMEKTKVQKNDVKVLVDCLTGTARKWARIYNENWNIYEDFKREFMNEYWGKDEQNRIKRKIINEKWNSKESKSMKKHFIELYDEAKMLPNYDEQQLVDEIMQQFPQDIRRMWLIKGRGGAKAAVEFLGGMDTTTDMEKTVPKSFIQQAEKSKIVRTSAALENIRKGYGNSWVPEGNNVIDLERTTSNKEKEN